VLLPGKDFVDSTPFIEKSVSVFSLSAGRVSDHDQNINKGELGESSVYQVFEPFFKCECSKKESIEYRLVI